MEEKSMNDLTCHEVIERLTAALRDAYSFIAAPRCMTPDSIRYETRGYNSLLDKMRAALREGERHAHN